MKKRKINRREFLKIGAVGLGAFALFPGLKLPYKPFLYNNLNEDIPQSVLIGRNCLGGKLDLHAKPTNNSAVTGTFYEDTLFEWDREVVGEAPDGHYSRRWVETPKGYAYAPALQPVKNLPNTPVSSLPASSVGKGMWVEVTVPYVEIYQDRAAVSPWLKESPHPRLYYSQVVWVDDVATNSNGVTLYRVNELYGSYGDIYWCEAKGFRPLTEDEIAPISPDVQDKKIVVDLDHQSMSCYENNHEVYFCKISSGAKFTASGKAVDKWSTPVGPHPIWRKLVSIHMSGGTTGGGWDIAGVAWTSLFAGTGVAVHSCFWHNDYGTPRSNGCINSFPTDAKFVFRWTTPSVSLDPGDKTVTMPGGTVVNVIEYNS